MRISEMQQREQFVDIMMRTLAKGWSEQYNEPILILPADEASEQTWFIQDLLSCCFVDGLGIKPRQFLRDSFCYTPVKWRIPAQWLLGNLLTTDIGLRNWSRPAFQVSKNLPNGKDLLIVPGNQRIRIFDFSKGTCRVLLKEGFDNRTIKTDIQVRGTRDKGPFVHITSWDLDSYWFEEPIIDGFALPRCPPWKSREKFEKRSFELLKGWINEHSVNISAQDRISTLVASINVCISTISQRFPQFDISHLAGWIPALAELAGTLGDVALSRTHGDFQPGNILVEKSSDEVFIIDWEHSKERYYLYDFLVYGLKTRSADYFAFSEPPIFSNGTEGSRQ